jgi:hypothetical protein
VLEAGHRQGPGAGRADGSASSFCRRDCPSDRWSSASVVISPLVSRRPRRLPGCDGEGLGAFLLLVVGGADGMLDVVSKRGESPWLLVLGQISVYGADMALSERSVDERHEPKAAGMEAFIKVPTSGTVLAVDLCLRTWWYSPFPIIDLGRGGSPGLFGRGGDG